MLCHRSGCRELGCLHRSSDRVLWSEWGHACLRCSNLPWNDDAAWHDAAWYDAAWHDAARHDAAWHDAARYVLDRKHEPKSALVPAEPGNAALQSTEDTWATRMREGQVFFQMNIQF